MKKAGNFPLTWGWDDFPLSGIMKSGPFKNLKFQYDSAELEAAGINIDRPISVRMQNATVDDFLHAVFDPLSISYDRKGNTVTLLPKVRRGSGFGGGGGIGGGAGKGAGKDK